MVVQHAGRPACDRDRSGDRRSNRSRLRLLPAPTSQGSATADGATRIRRLTAVVFVTLALAGCVGAGSPENEEAAVPSRTGEVTWIPDGDTIEVETPEGSIEVRLLATNAPDQGECFADEGLDHLIDTLKERRVRLEDFGEDQFDRTLAHVFEGERHINLEMVAEGFSLASTPGDDDPYAGAILDAEEAAFQNGEGLWSPRACRSDELLPAVVIDTRSSVADPAGGDEDNLSGETISIINEGTGSVDLSGWMLRDESTRHRYRFPNGLTLLPGETHIVASSDPEWDPGGSPVWNNGGDMALLQLADGTVVDRWRYTD